VLSRTRRDVIDVTVQTRVRRGAYTGRTRSVAEVVRVVAVRHPESRAFHAYIINLGSEYLAAEEIAATHAGCWTIELVFKELKTTYRLDDISSARKHVVEALILAAILTMNISGPLLRLI
jgi:IS4 transposase